MGLEVVELIMSVEEEFGITIPDGDAETISLLGSLHDYVMKELRNREEVPDGTDVWNRLKALVVREFDFPADKLTRSTNIFDDLGAD